MSNINLLEKETEDGVSYKDIAEYVLGECDMCVASEMPEEDIIMEICKALDETPKALLYFLSNATENSK